MNTTTKLLASALLLALLGACSKEEAPAPVEAPVAAPAPEAVAPAPPPTPSAGGYEPTADERVPGVTIPQEEVDKKMAELLKDTPKPIIPGEAPAEAPAAEAPAADAEAAPAETK